MNSDNINTNFPNPNGETVHEDVVFSNNGTFVNSESNGQLNSKLKEWALQYHVNHKQLNSLLSILKPIHPNLPLSSRTLLETKRYIELKIMKTARGDDGYYYYFGISSFYKIISKMEQHVLSKEMKLNCFVM